MGAQSLKGALQALLGALSSYLGWESLHTSQRVPGSKGWGSPCFACRFTGSLAAVWDHPGRSQQHWAGEGDRAASTSKGKKHLHPASCIKKSPNLPCPHCSEREPLSAAGGGSGITRGE